MSASPRWQRRRAARPGELLEQALICFSELGVEATTLDEIARRAGVTKGTIYHYFSGKDDLFEHLVTDLALPEIESMAVTVAAVSGSHAERLETLMRRHWELLTTTQLGRIPRLIMLELRGRSQLAERLFERIGQQVFGLYARTIAEGTAGGAFIAIEPRIAAQLCAMPIVARLLVSGIAGSGMLGDGQVFIDAHCAAVRRWLCIREVA